MPASSSGRRAPLVLTGLVAALLTGAWLTSVWIEATRSVGDQDAVTVQAGAPTDRVTSPFPATSPPSPSDSTSPSSPAPTPSASPSVPASASPSASPTRSRATIYFSATDVRLGPSARALLDAVAANAMRSKTSRIQVLGHSDGHGTLAQRRAAAMNRAHSVADYLLARGVPPSRISHDAAVTPTAPPVSPEADVRNRRVEIVVTDRA